MSSVWNAFATVNPFDEMTASNPGKVQNLVAGQWESGDEQRVDIVDPMNGAHFLSVPDTTNVVPFLDGLNNCPKSGLHNPMKSTERYVHLGRVCARSAALLADPEVADYFAELTQRVMPKSWQQCMNEVTVTRIFLENFSGDGVRFLGRGFSNPGDHAGQESRGYRWPFGAVVVVAPFNFPLEIPALQALGALFMGNRPLVKVDSKVSVVFEQFLRLLIHCGLSPNDIDLIHCRGERMGELIKFAADQIRLVQFTGSSVTADKVSDSVNGRVRLEDAGYDWKIIGPDFDDKWLDYVAWQCDEDAYNASGQKCSAQSVLFVHDNWVDSLLPKLRTLAQRRNLADLSIGPVLSWDNTQIRAHIDAVLDVPGAELLFGGSQLTRHHIPQMFGAYEATAIRAPIQAFLGHYFDLLTTELFGPFQIIVSYGSEDLDAVLSVFEQMSNNLTAAVVSANVGFQNQVLRATVNGTTYCGMRARTTGAPQNHWFGPCGDPRGAGIGTPEAITTTWSTHREVIFDEGELPENWEIPALK
ncbi:MAG TPA: aldehyde dehydrogenase family protein [Woeseiaceae bacterium]|nr:aldehyde dehydrogenase family protein [Woeseiaceae bacterium]